MSLAPNSGINNTLGRRDQGLIGRNSQTVATGGDFAIEDFLGPMDGAVGQKMRADDVLSHETFNADKVR